MATPFIQTESGLTAEQASGSKLDYGLDWSDWLEKAPGDVIEQSLWTNDDGIITSDAQIAGSITSIWVTGGSPGQWYTLENRVVTRDGRIDTRVCMVYVKTATSSGSALFPSRLVALAKIRRDRLVMLANSLMPSLSLTDDYIWEKLLAAESETAHELRVPLAPTAFFPAEPTTEEVAALAGKPWGVDPGYDYSPEAFGYSDKWGMIKLRNKPLHSVSRVRFAYPGGRGSSYDLPLDWLRMDKKYGTIQFVPSSTAFLAPLNAFVMQAIGNGRTIPLAIQISYVAGLESVSQNFPELIDVVQKKAVIKIIDDAYLPQSASISADGLSQSMSVDTDKYHAAVDQIMNGGKGSNGGLMTAIHGVRIGAL